MFIKNSFLTGRTNPQGKIFRICSKCIFEYLCLVKVLRKNINLGSSYQMAGVVFWHEIVKIDANIHTWAQISSLYVKISLNVV